MRKALVDLLSLDDHLECFGGFNIKDPICKKYCAISLRCAIEQEQNARIELLDKLVSTDSTHIKIQ